MNRKQESPRVSRQALRACRELLRQVDHPRVLRNNILLRHVPVYEIACPAFSHRLRRVIEAALELVTPRQRAVLLRCDLGGERFSIVANDIGISERHLFRERAKSLAWIASSVLTADLTSAVTPIAVDDSTELLLALARSLEQSGETRRASELLITGVRNISDAFNRCRVETRLAFLYVSAGSIESAKHSIERARALCRDVEVDSWIADYVDLAAAQVAWDECNDQDAERLLNKGLRQLRRSSALNLDWRNFDALAKALLTRSIFDYDHGRLKDAQNCVDEGLSVLNKSLNADATVSLDLRLEAGLIRMTKDGDHEYYAKSLSECYAQAIGQNLVREALGIRVKAGSLYRKLNDLERAHSILATTLSAARANTSGDVLACALIEHAMVDQLQGRSYDALSKLEEGYPYMRGLKSLQDVARLVEASVSLTVQDYRKALALSEVLENHFQGMGRLRCVAETLHIRARALMGVARFTDARLAASASMEIFEQIRIPAGINRSRKLLLAVGTRRNRITHVPQSSQGSPA